MATTNIERSMNSPPRLSTGVAGLDGMLGGGYLAGDSTLLAGAPGTGKTTFGLHFISAGIKANQHAIYVTFEYLPQQIYRDAAKRGWPLRQWEDEGKLKLLCTTPDVLFAEDEAGLSLLDEIIKGMGAQRLVLDAVTHLEYMGKTGPQLREQVAGLVNHLRLLNVTTLVTHELPQIAGPATVLSQYGLEFLVDNVIMLRYVELEGELRKALNVLKFRGGDHDRKFRVVRAQESGLSVESDFHDVENISAGTARRTIEQRVRQIV